MDAHSLPPTMRALTLPPPPYTPSSPFPPSALKYTSSHPTPPSLSPTHYTIHVTHTALTRSELTWPETLSPTRKSASIPGHDVVGTIISVPTTLAENAHKFTPGDTVFALLSFSTNGAASDYALALPSELAPLPQGTTHEAAAAAPLSALSAWQAFFEHAGLHPPSSSPSPPPPAKPTRILITGASGGVGAMAVQIARLLPSAYVVGTCSARNESFVRSLGADDVIDYTARATLAAGLSTLSAPPSSSPSSPEEQQGDPFDIILDTVGGPTLSECCAPPLIADGGKVISVAMPLSAAQEAQLRIHERGVSCQFFIVRPDGAQLETIARFMEGRRVKGVVDSVWELEKGAEAMEVVEKGRCTGKVVLRVN
jgi:NADPH:quinone reductase-like Zn-dependent oxidoreductase